MLALWVSIQRTTSGSWTKQLIQRSSADCFPCGSAKQGPELGRLEDLFPRLLQNCQEPATWAISAMDDASISKLHGRFLVTFPADLRQSPSLNVRRQGESGKGFFDLPAL